MLSRGVPMFVAGDEVRRTQGGNNNAYCQDNEVSWFDWGLIEEYPELLRFWQRLIEFRKTHAVLRYGRFFSGARNDRGILDIDWHGVRLHEPGWDDPNARSLAFTLAGFDNDPDLHVMMNMYWEPLVFELPSIPGRGWRIAFDTFDDSVDGDPRVVRPRSIVVLVNGEDE